MVRTNHMIAHCHEKIKKQLPSLLHLHLHRPTTLKRRPAPDNQGKVVSTKRRIGIRRIGIGEASTGENGAAMDTEMETLFPKCEAFELI